MELIDKSALVAEIDSWRDNIIKAISDIPLTGRDRADATFEYEILGKVEGFLDFFKVKEVDFEKEWKEYFKYGGDVATVNVKHLAKHFFELGLQVNNPITAADRGMTEEIIINLKRVEQDYNLDLTREMEWLRNKAQKVKEVQKLTVDDIMRIDALLISMWHNKLENNSYEEVLKQFKAQKGK